MLYIEVSPKIKRLALYFLVLIVCVFFIHRFVAHRSGFLEKAAATILYPVLRIQNACTYPFKKWMHDYKTNAQLRSELAQALEEKESLIDEVNQLQGQFDFAKNTKELIEYRSRYRSNITLLAQVLVKNISDEEHFFLIDKGSRHGITSDMIAVYKNCLIGRIDQVTPFWSKVILITDKKCKVAALCCKSNEQGIYEGSNSSTGSLKYISHLNTLYINDLVITSGAGLVFPHGFGIGRITHFEPHGLYYEVEIKPLLDVHAINYCYLINKGE